MLSRHPDPTDDAHIPPLLTILDLVEAVSELTDDRSELVVAVSHLLSSGAVRRPAFGDLSGVEAAQ